MYWSEVMAAENVITRFCVTMVLTYRDMLPPEQFRVWG